MTANRIQTYHDFGYVALDILGVRAEDSGTYVVVARNALGEAQLSATMQVEGNLKKLILFVPVYNDIIYFSTCKHRHIHYASWSG